MTGRAHSDDGTAAQRLVSPDLFAVPPDATGASTVEGEPRTVTTPVTRFADLEIGVWDIEPGTAHDTEDDEIFVVLAGAGVLRFEDGSSIELRPGVLVRLAAGDRTTWEIAEPLRKLYVA